MSLRKGVTTGLVGYSLRKERLGEGLFYRETETFEIDLQVTDFDMTSTAIGDLQTQIKSYFSTRSGDINVKMLAVPTDYQLPNDSVRIAKFNVEVENRKTVNIADSSLTASYYSGVNSNFWTLFATNFKDFSEEFSYEKSDNGSLVANHSISFGLITGNRAMASSVATNIFNVDNNPPHVGIGNQIASYSQLDSNSVQQFYTESFDLMKNAYSFAKKTEYPPIGSDAAYGIKKNISHSVELGQDGVINVVEKGTIKALKNFSQAKSEADMIRSSSNAFNRCSQVYNAFSSLMGGGDGLVNFPIKNEVTYNAPALTAEYTIGYSDNPSVNAAGSFSVEKILDVSIEENKSVSVSHTYNFIQMKKATSAETTESDNYSLIEQAKNESPTIATAFYQGSSFYNESWPTLTMVRDNLRCPSRAKNFSISFSYSNEPIYNVVINGQSYKKVEYKITDSKPIDMANEYKVINRPTKTSVMSYAYQTEKATKTISVNAVVERSGVFLYPMNLNSVTYPLYLFAIEKLLLDFRSQTALAFSYHLSDVKVELNSEYEVRLSMTLTYTMKKYVA